ncbi:aspartate/glutamate racemase family protein [bacterium]|nr:aspartate/glutamate racemase family protein [bacterium]
MKTIGMIGGMSWESTLTYYQLINEGIKKSMGGLHSAKICLYSVDFDEIEKLQHKGDWKEAAKVLSDAAVKIEACGADFLVICTNTMHKLAPEIESSISIPVLHIADATGEQLKKDRVTKAGLLGTMFTMEQDFYRERLKQKHGIEVLVPKEQDRDIVHKVIYKELCLGSIVESSRNEFIRIINNLKKRGAEGVILGCTEIPLLIKQEHTSVPLYDTTKIHAEAAVRLAVDTDI